MTNYTQDSIEKAILGTGEQLEAATEELGELTVASARAEVEYKRRYAVVFLSMENQEGTVVAKEQRTHLQVLQEYQDMKIKEAQVRAQQELCRTHRARLDAFRTVAANWRVQV